MNPNGPKRKRNWLAEKRRVFTATRGDVTVEVFWDFGEGSVTSLPGSLHFRNLAVAQRSEENNI